MTPTLELTAGLIVRIDGHEGRWRVVERCKDAVGRSWWVIPCNVEGVWDRREGWHATYPERCRLVEPPRVRRHYRRKGEK
jgi:hypothetical protein